MGSWDFLNESVGSQQPQFPADGRRSPTFFLQRHGAWFIEQGLQITVAQAIQHELSAVDRFQQSVIFGGEGMQRANTLFAGSTGAFHLSDQFRNPAAVIDHTQGIEITFIGLLRDFSPAVQICHPVTQLAPFVSFRQ